jgi:hypothetical protein
MTEAKPDPFRLYLFRSTSPQQREKKKEEETEKFVGSAGT